MPVRTLFLSLSLPFALLPFLSIFHRSVSVLAVWYRESFRTKRKHFDFQRDDGGQRKLVDHADVDNRATGANLHTSILTNFSSAWRRFRLPSLAPPHPCIRTDLWGGEPTTVFPGSAGLSRDLVEIRNIRSGKICGTNSRDRVVVSRRSRLSSTDEFSFILTRTTHRCDCFYADVR